MDGENSQPDRGDSNADGNGRARVRAADTDRDTVLSILGEAHSAGRLDVEELDERQSAAMRAKYLDELAPLISDLPEGAGGPGTGHPGALGPDAGTNTGTASPANRPRSNGTRGENNLPALPGGGRPQTTVAIMSGRDLQVESGTPEVTSFSLWGGDNIFLRNVMAPGVQVTIHLYALMAGTDIFVPAGVKVLDRSVNIMGGTTVHRDAQGDGSNGTLVLNGLTIMGGHDVKLDRDSPQALQN